MNPRLPPCQGGDHTRLIYQPSSREHIKGRGVKIFPSAYKSPLPSSITMQLMETFRARGHPNIRAGHRTTLMVTREPELTPRGDCIVAVAAEKGLMDLDPQVKEAMRSRDARIRLVLEVGGPVFEVSGRGDPGLTLSHPTDMIARRSGYICDRTLMVRADRAACDLKPPLLRLLQNREQVVNVTLVVDGV